MSSPKEPSQANPNSSSYEAATRELNHIRHALDQSAIVAITDRSGTIIHVNDKFCEISKYSRKELLGQNHRIINSGHHSKEFFQELWKTISSGEIWEGEIRNRAKDGSFYWVNTTIVPYADENGKPFQYVSIRYEITRRKQVEEQLRVYADRLEQTNRELVEREAQIIVQDRLASVGLLASSLAHEIGTPLGVIRGRAEYLDLQVKGDPEVKKNIDIIVSQIDRVSQLIRSLLNLARGDQRSISVQIDLNTVVSEVIELMGHELRKHKIQIYNDLSQDLAVKVRAESGPLHQVLLNLLVNSVHAIETAIRSGRSENHFIRLTAEEEGAFWAVQVQDSGCGISEANMKNLFKPFFTTKDIGVGTGLGLVTSYRIVESWGGLIRVKSKEGVGSEFQIHLPKIEPKKSGH